MPELDISAKVEWKHVPWEVNVDFNYNKETVVEYIIEQTHKVNYTT